MCSPIKLTTGILSLEFQGEFSAKQRCEAVREEVHVWLQWRDMLELRPGKTTAVSSFYTTNLLYSVQYALHANVHSIKYTKKKKAYVIVLY